MTHEITKMTAMRPETARIGSALRAGRFAILAVLAVTACIPAFHSNYLNAIATEIMIFAVFAMSLDLLIGYTGLLSFGHAAFFGIGAYTVMIANIQFGVSPWIGIPLGMILASVAAFVTGYFCLKATGLAFLMLTMAFSQLAFSVAVKWRAVTGGTDGLVGLQKPSIFGWSLSNPTAMFYLALVVLVVSYFILRRLVNSPFGHVLIGIRENESRMRAIGFPVRLYKLAIFVIGGAFAGLAGGIYAIFNGYISPDAFSWTASGDPIIMIVLGGIGTLVGPVIGAAILLLLKQIVSGYTEYWLFIIGVTFVICVSFFPKGIVGRIVNLGGGRAP